MRKTILCLILGVAFLLPGCGFLDNMPKPPKVTPYPTAITEAQQVQPAQAQEESSVSENHGSQGLLARIHRISRDAYDPENHTELILNYYWDEVRVESAQNPEAAEKITETLASMQDTWYTGKGSSEYDLYGYDAMLSAAEDNYAFMKEYPDMGAMFYASREVELLRADEQICVFLIWTYTYLGGAHGSYQSEAVVFNSRTGERLQLEDLSENPDALKDTLVSEMMRLVQEDDSDYYEGHLDLTAPEDYEESLRKLLRDGSWYPGEDAFHIFSDLYELGSYASGITDFAVPYESLSLDCTPHWRSSKEAKLSLVPLLENARGEVEILDRVTVSEEGENWLLICEGRADALEIKQVSRYGDSWYSGSQNYYCEYLEDGALQLVLSFPGDLPTTALCYRDQNGEHSLLISLSGEDGSALLTEAVIG